MNNFLFFSSLYLSRFIFYRLFGLPLGRGGKSKRKKKGKERKKELFDDEEDGGDDDG